MTMRQFDDAARWYGVFHMEMNVVIRRALNRGEAVQVVVMKTQFTNPPAL
jgi:hypothetical protein